MILCRMKICGVKCLQKTQENRRNMDWKKIGLLGAIGIVTWQLMIEWNQFSENGPQYALKAPISDGNPVAVNEEQRAELPSDLPAAPRTSSSVYEKTQTAEDTVSVRTDVLEMTIDLHGGDIIDVRLLEHLTKMPEKGGQPIQLLERSNESLYIATSGLIGRDGTDSKETGRPVFQAAQRSFDLAGEDVLEVDLLLELEGVKIVKQFSFQRGNYNVGLTYSVRNNRSKDWEARFFGQIKRDSKPPPELTSVFGQTPFLGAALREPEKNFAKYGFNEIREASISTELEGGWLAFLQHYYVAAWIPPADQKNRYDLKQSGAQDDMYLLSVIGAPFLVPSGETGRYAAQFYVGPKDQVRLNALAEHFELVVDYGFFWIICQPIYHTMVAVYDVVGNWGWAIIVLTLLIKVLLFPLSAKGLKSMARMRRLQPEMERLKELYGEDRQKMGVEQMALFKKEKVNPLGGCLPMILQMPIFISFFWVLSESVEIRHAPWLLWIQDLSAIDPYFILPLMMGASMYAMQKMQPMPTDPMQAKVMQYMPVAFTFMFMWFPSGLVLYWTVSNILQMGQQWVVNRQILAADSQ